MGILNLTPDSFSDGGRYMAPQAAWEHAKRLADEGAAILDLGAESTRPGARPVSESEELERLLPVLDKIAGRLPVPLSIDTTKPGVAKKCFEAGAAIVNDVSGLRESGREMAEVVHRFGAGLVIMHRRGTPETMQQLARYPSGLAEILGELKESVGIALAAGIKREQVVIDPGLGFAKTAAQNLEILKNLKAFSDLGFPVMIGPSRKSFIGQLTGREAADREFGTAACVTAAVMQGARILRVHDVKAMRDVVLVAEAIQSSN